jgi:hypothetical protein
VPGVSGAGPGTVSDDQLEQMLQQGIRAGSLPANDANRLYVVFVQPNMSIDARTNWAGPPPRGSGQATTGTSRRRTARATS